LADFTTATSDAQPERISPRRNSNPGTGVPILASRHDKILLFAIRSVDFSCFSLVAVDFATGTRRPPPAQMGLALGTVPTNHANNDFGFEVPPF
jgi:hypothetical protein